MEVVTAFQRHFRPERVDGVADHSTMTTLHALLASLPEEATTEVAAKSLKPAFPSCPGLSRASTSYFLAHKSVDGRDKPGHDA